MLYEPDNPAHHYRPSLAPALIAKQQARMREIALQAERAEQERKKAEEEKRAEAFRQAELERLERIAKRRNDIRRMIEEQAADEDRRAIMLLEMELLDRAKYRVSLKRIIHRICSATGVSVSEIMSDRRHVKVVLARQAVFYWAMRRTTLSMPQIGKHIGGRDHTTVLHGIRSYVKKRAAQGRTLRPARG